jgi:catechol 2,3-dioxygenase-like lactoylglutathione lyase family enzyme
MKIDRFDHIVLTVKSIEATCASYTKVLGMKEITFSEGRKALLFGNQKINLHRVGTHLYPPVATNPIPGAADICLITSLPMDSVIQHITACGIKILEGPVNRTGAIGMIQSVYINDPDGNLIEISKYK